jgi:N utilization substance protein B
VRSARHQARLIAVQMLYAYDMIDQTQDSAHFLEESKLSDKYKTFACNLFEGVCAQLESIDRRLRLSLNKDWEIDRLGRVERSILRLGCYELLFTAIDPPIAISEAVELAKEMADDNAPKLINGVLETIRKERTA